MIDDLTVDPQAQKRLIAGLTGSGGLAGAVSTAFARPKPPGPGGLVGSLDPGLQSAVRAKFPGGTASASVPGLDAGADAPRAPLPGSSDMKDLPRGPMGLETTPPPNDAFHHDYSAGSNINNSGKNKFGRFKGTLGHDPTDDEIRQFVAANPNEWEDTTSPGGEYVFRQKQNFLNDPNNQDSKTGATSIWQNRNFVNAAGSGDGYAPPYQEQQAQLPGGGTGMGPFGGLSPTLASGDPNEAILALLGEQGQIPSILQLMQGMGKGA